MSLSTCFIYYSMSFSLYFHWKNVQLFVGDVLRSVRQMIESKTRCMQQTNQINEINICVWLAFAGKSLTQRNDTIACHSDSAKHTQTYNNNMLDIFMCASDLILIVVATYCCLYSRHIWTMTGNKQNHIQFTRVIKTETHVHKIITMFRKKLWLETT